MTNLQRGGQPPSQEVAPLVRIQAPVGGLVEELAERQREGGELPDNGRGQGRGGGAFRVTLSPAGIGRRQKILLVQWGWICRLCSVNPSLKNRTPGSEWTWKNQNCKKNPKI